MNEVWVIVTYLTEDRIGNFWLYSSFEKAEEAKKHMTEKLYYRIAMYPKQVDQ